MTKEDEARLEWLRKWHTTEIEAFLIRLLDKSLSDCNGLLTAVQISEEAEAIRKRTDDYLMTKAEVLHGRVVTLTAERDEQAARVAKLEETGELLASDHFDRCNECDHGEARATTCAVLAPWDAAIRARAGSPKCCGNVGCINWDRPPGYAGTNGPCRCSRPVAPGEVKPSTGACGACGSVTGKRDSAGFYCGCEDDEDEHLDIADLQARG